MELVRYFHLFIPVPVLHIKIHQIIDWYLICNVMDRRFHLVGLIVMCYFLSFFPLVLFFIIVVCRNEHIYIEPWISFFFCLDRSIDRSINQSIVFCCVVLVWLIVVDPRCCHPRSCYQWVANVCIYVYILRIAQIDDAKTLDKNG